MKRCINCNNEIDDNITICNYCGTPQMNYTYPQYNAEASNQFNNNNNSFQSSNRNNDENLKKQRKSLIIAIIVSIILIVAFILFLMFLSNMNSDDKKDNGNNNNDDIEETNNIDDIDNIDNNVEQTFYGEGFTIKYSSPWKKVQLQTTNGKSVSALMYEKYKSQVAFSQVGVSDLSGMNIDFSTSDGKKALYDTFYEYWNKDGSVTKDTYGFLELKDKVWYGVMNNNDTHNGIYGKIYLIVAEENNAILSFELQATNASIVSETHNEVLKLLDTITVNVLYDNQMVDYLNKMSNWNIYSDARRGSLGTQKSIEGEWRILSSSEVYWVFKGNEFYWYKSFNDLNDNYWYGTYEKYIGKEGFKKLGLDPNTLDGLIVNGRKVEESDVYALILTPKKIITDGEDKSDTNIADNSTWNQLWVIVDHGEEGLEGKQVSIDDNSEKFYVKVKDY